MKILEMLKTEILTILSLIHRRIMFSSSTERDIVSQFHELYYEASQSTWQNTSWLGVKTLKCPLDLWIYQEIIFDLKPDLIIETGTASGGSALYLASLCDLLNNGKVITVDIEKIDGRPTHNRITYLTGSSVSDDIVKTIAAQIHNADKVMVILDSDHTKNHVLKELNIYSKFVTLGSYLIVEDTNVNGHPISPAFGEGPMEAVDEMLKTNSNFTIDKDKEKYFLTFNPRGYLRRIK